MRSKTNRMPPLPIMDGHSICWMCGGWGIIHPLDTGEIWHDRTGNTGSVYVWAASRAKQYPGSVTCPACFGDGKTDRPYISEITGSVMSIAEKIW